MSQFISKENVHEATDIPRICSLMANAERLGEDELEIAEDSNEQIRRNTV